MSESLFIPKGELTIAATPLPVDMADERDALRFRHSRVAQGPLAQAALEFAVESPDVIRAFVEQAPDLRRDSKRRGELHRSITPHIAATMTDPDSRRKVMAALDETTTLESDRLKQEANAGGKGLDADVLIVGAGVQAAIFAAAYRAEFPDARIIAAERGDRLGGQFRSYGDRPVFRINSRGFRREATMMLGPGRPGEGSNLNSFGLRAPLQLPDISSETYPTNIDMGDTAAINQYLSAETMLQTRVSYISGKNPTADRYNVFAENLVRGPELRINPKQIVLATGAGDRKAFKEVGSRNVWTAEDLFTHFANPNNPFPMKEFIGKRGAIIGGGDTGRVVAELFSRLAPKEAYGRSVVQLGNQIQLDWFGTDFDDREEFCEKTRSRYEPLAPFIRSRKGYQRSAPITPYKRKVVSLRPLENNSDLVRLEDDTGLATAYPFVIVATPIEPGTVNPLYGDGGSDNRELVQRVVPEFRNEVAAIARRSAYGAYTIGPAALMPLTQLERGSFAEGIKENTAAIWANVIRTESLARELAHQARASK